MRGSSAKTCRYGLNEDILYVLAGWMFRVQDGLKRRLVVGEYGTPARSGPCLVHLANQLQSQIQSRSSAAYTADTSEVVTHILSPLFGAVFKLELKVCPFWTRKLKVLSHCIYLLSSSLNLP